MEKKIIGIDGFCGGGGASHGLKRAGIDINIAINHDQAAILLHETNHPETQHLTEDIFTVDLTKYLSKDCKVGVMWASPDCTHHSKAKGDKPLDANLRMLPWAVHGLCEQILEITGSLPDVLFMENVEEIQDWGPLDENGRPIKERKGEEFKAFIAAMEQLGFVFEGRELVAADYGAPTTRNRWYGIFRSDGKQIVWPVPTHDKNGADELPKWIPVSTVIDWTDLGKSIFDRKKPLAEATQSRIAKGIKKFIVDNPEPFIVPEKEAMAFLIQYHSETRAQDVRGQSLGEPIRTLDTSNRYGLVTAFITKYYKTGIGQGCDEPITTSPGHFGLVSAFLIKYYGTNGGQPVDMPLHTITTKDRFGLVNVILTVKGEKYIISDIFLRMLKAEPELKLAQGFDADYIITHDHTGRKYPIKEQVAKIGNSVVPVMAEMLARANVNISHSAGRKGAHEDQRKSNRNH